MPTTRSSTSTYGFSSDSMSFDSDTPVIPSRKRKAADDLAKEVKRLRLANGSLQTKLDDAEKRRQDAEHRREDEVKKRKSAHSRIDRLKLEISKLKDDAEAARIAQQDWERAADDHRRRANHFRRELQQDRDRVQNTNHQPQRQRNHLQEVDHRLEARQIIDPADTADIGNIIECSICCETMAVPHVLLCGHSFHANCLDRWFTHTLDTFKRTEVLPDFNPAERYHQRAVTMVEHAHIRTFRYVHELGRFILNRQSKQPQYVCPLCRSPQTCRPAQNYTLKAVATRVVQGEDAPPPNHDQHLLWEKYWPTVTDYYRTVV